MIMGKRSTSETEGRSLAAAFRNAILVITACSAFLGTSYAQQYTAGTAKIDITPSNYGFSKMWLNGFAFRGDTPANICSDPLGCVFARALAISDGSSKKVVVTMDVVSIPQAVHDAIAAKVASKYSIPTQDLLLASIHTHSAPVLTGQTDLYAEFGFN